MKGWTRIAAYTLAFLALPVLTGAWGLTRALIAFHTAPSPPVLSIAPAVERDESSRRPVVAIVVGDRVTDLTALLVPYAVLADSGAVDVFTVAPQRRLSAVWPALQLFPDYSFEQIDRAFPAGPDRIVVPFGAGSDERRVEEWLGDGGAPADRTVRLAGDEATLTAIFEASFGLLEELAGSEVANRTALDLGLGSAHDRESPRPAGVGDRMLGLLGAAYEWNRSSVGIFLYDGIDDLRLAAAVDLHQQTRTGKTVVLAPALEFVRTRAGLVFVPSHSIANVRHLDRALVPGDRPAAITQDTSVQEWARRRRLELELFDPVPAGQSYASMLRALAARVDVPTARMVGRTIGVPPDGAVLRSPDDGAGWPHRLWLRPLLLGLLGLAICRVALRLRTDRDC